MTAGRKPCAFRGDGFSGRVRSGALLVALVALAATVPAVGAEETVAQDIDQITVTGSRIKRTRQRDIATPLSSFDQDELRRLGINEVRDLLQLLPGNSGSQNNADALSQNYTVGTSNINLRGLGVSSTLVLLNGRRQVTSSIPTIDGSGFVDTAALIPMLALERVEILEDGAAAIYGSDAIAGVANFVTRTDYEGFDLSAEHRERTGNGTQVDDHFDAVFGRNFRESGNVLVALSHLSRTLLGQNEVDWRVPAWSSASNPGNFAVLRETTLADGTVIAPGVITAAPHCSDHAIEGGHVPPAALAGNTGVHSLCRFDFAPQITMVPEEERLQAFARLAMDAGSQMRVSGEFGYARNNIVRIISPSLPAISPNLAHIPAEHPGNPFRDADAAPVDLRYIGRAYGYGEPPERNDLRHETTRLALIAEGEAGEDVFWDVSYIHAGSDAEWRLPDTLHARLQEAMGASSPDDDLLGVGPDCADSREALEAGDVCLLYNPFSVENKVLAMTWGGTEFGEARGGTAEEQAFMRDYLIVDALGSTESELDVLEAVFTGEELFTLAGGPAGYAFGVQYRDESIRGDYSPRVNNFEFSFLGGNPDYSGSRDAVAVFGELLLPVGPTLEAALGLRHEDYGGAIGSTTDPKLSVLWAPSESLSLRGSASSSFRAPSLHQTHGAQTTFSDVVEGGNQFFVPNVTRGNRNLKPETATSLNLGLSLTGALWEFDLDYWDFRFEDALSRESTQGVVDEDSRRVAAGEESRLLRSSGGTIARVYTRYINTDEIRTSGIDLALRRRHRTEFGDFSLHLNATYVREYDITQADGRRIDGAGWLNRSNIGSPMPRWRGHTGLTWRRGGHQALMLVNHVDDYGHRHAGGVDRIDSFTSVDVQYRLDLGRLPGSDAYGMLTVGLLNVTDEDPPFVNIAGSYDPKTGDPRGRRAYVRLGASFE